MKCHNVISKTSDYFEDMLTSQEKQILDQHLDSCEDCKREYTAYATFFEELKYSNTPKVPEGFLERLHDRMDKECDASQEGTSSGVLTFFYKSIPAPVRIALVAASVIFAIYMVFFTNLLTVSFSNKTLVKTIIEEPVIFDDHAQQSNGQSIDIASKDTKNQNKELFFKNNTDTFTSNDKSLPIEMAQDSMNESPDGKKSSQQIARVPDIKTDAEITISEPKTTPPTPQQTVNKIASAAFTLKNDEMAVYLDYESFRPEIASVDPHTKIPDPGIDKNIEGYNGLGYFADMLELIHTIAEDSQGAVVDRKAGPPPYIIVRVPTENLSAFISKLDQYGDKQVLLPPDNKDIDAAQLDQDGDGFVQVHLKILIP